MSTLTCCHVLRTRAGFAGKITIVPSIEDDEDVTEVLQNGIFQKKYNIDLVNLIDIDKTKK